MVRRNTWNEKLKRAREEKGLSQLDLANKIGTNQQKISRWEQGINKPGHYFRSRLSEELGQSIEELGFLEERDETPHESKKNESQQTPPVSMPPKPFFIRREVIISLVVVGVVIAGVLIYLISVSQKETVTFPLTAGANGATTKHSYTGTTTITVSGTGQVAGTQYSDAFYIYTNSNGQPITPLHYKDFLSLCINAQPVDRFVKTIPPYNPNHIYTFQIDVPGVALMFGICDSGVRDNTGSFTITISQGIFAIFTQKS